MKIAITDDDSQDLLTLTEMMRHGLAVMGYYDNLIDTFPSAEKLLSTWTAGKYTLILLDIYMDGMHGIDAARKIREQDKDVRLVFCTSGNDFASESYEVGAQDYLRKPVTEEGILKMLKKLDPQICEFSRFATLPDGRRIILRNILYTDYHNHIVTIHNKKGEAIQTRISQSELENLLCRDSWFYHIYGNTQSSLEIALQPVHALFLLAINAGALLIYHIIVQLINEYDRNSILESQNHILTIEALQYKNLQEKIRETRQARHDLKHHITVMTGLLNEGNTEKLKAYLEGYRKSLPDDTSVSFCRNSTVNLLLQYFSQQAELAGIPFTAHADVPENPPIAEHDLAVLLGNLLENAVNACSAQNSMERRITFRGKFENNFLVFTIDNTFEGDLIPSEDGGYLSTKRREPGIGLSSARHIAARYKGILRTEQKDGIFYASVLLYLK